MAEVVEVRYRVLLAGGGWRWETRILEVEDNEPEQDDEPDETPPR